MCGRKGAGEKSRLKHNERVLDCAQKAQKMLKDRINNSLVEQTDLLEGIAARLSASK